MKVLKNATIVTMNTNLDIIKNGYIIINDNGDKGIAISSSSHSNIVHNNTINNNDNIGITIGATTGSCNITHNIISDNTNDGVKIYSGNNNHILIGNTLTNDNNIESFIKPFPCGRVFLCVVQ